MPAVSFLTKEFLCDGFHTIAVFLFVCVSVAAQACTLCVNGTAAANSKLNCNVSRDVTTLTRLKKQINKGFPTGVESVCISVRSQVSVCVCYSSRTCPFLSWGGGRVWVLRRSWAQTHVRACVRTHTPPPPSAAAICAGKHGGEKRLRVEMEKGIDGQQ